MSKLFKFHVGPTSTVSIWAEDQKHAITRFRDMCPDVVFIIESEWQRRMAKAAV